MIVLGASIGSGEFLLGPAVFVRHGLSLLWATGFAVLLQTVFNIEVMRYTLATGEPIVTGFMRMRPSSTAWAWAYSGFYFLQFGWPAWAANAAGAIFFLITRRVAGPTEASAVFYIGVATFLLCVAILLVGRRIERTLEVLNWVMVVCILGGFVVLDLLFVPFHTWIAAATGFSGFDSAQARFDLLPRGADFFLLAGLVAYAGAGGVANLTLSNWARDKGYGMGSRVGYIPGAVGGEKVNLAHSGFMFSPDAEAMNRWRGWWRIIRADQWGVFFTGALLGMALPALLYVTFLPRGTDIRGLGIAAALAASMGERLGPVLAISVAFLGAWLLFKTQLDAVDGMTRAVTDILWTGSRRIRAWRGGDVRAVYYAVLAALVIWGVTALRLTQPIVLLQMAANVAGFVLIISSIQLLYVNTRLLPVELRPPMWRRAALVVTALFYSFFLALSIRSFI
ncbi:MAG TPA: Nramp family divalent metal transporter [Gemmatimonadaceae bacterium]